MIHAGIDPGVKFAAAAIHEDGQLTSAFYVQGESALETAELLVHAFECQLPREVLRDVRFAVEKPQVYRQHLLKGDPNDLIDVTMMGSYFAKEFDDVVWYLPKEWKGQMKKSITERLVLKELDAEEISRIELPSAKSLHHNVWDAVGITLFHARRIRIQGLRPK